MELVRYSCAVDTANGKDTSEVKLDQSSGETEAVGVPPAKGEVVEEDKTKVNDDI